MSRSILVVDDDRQMVRTLRDVLELSGWRTAGAHDGASAVEALSRADYDAVLMDIRMPGMNGVEALRSIRARKPRARVVLMTAFTAPELVQEAEREGALRVLPKPVSLPPLLDLLHASLHADSVMVVDDDPLFLRTLTDLLAQQGYTVVPARSCDEAIEAMQRQQPAAVLLHLARDQRDPQDCVLAIRKVSASVVLILYSGDPARIGAGLPPGWVHARLQKPFQIDELKALLDDAIRH